METLRRGSAGTAVRELQSQLKGLGFYEGDVDGDFGPRTERAVRMFQEARGLGVDGVVGPGTWAALQRPEPPEPPSRALRLGDHGEAVRQLQEALQAQGHYRGPIDGAYGGGTLAAVRAFQAAAGLGVDGIAGANTWNALFREDEVPRSRLLDAPLIQRCLALTGGFETGLGHPEYFAVVTGDFDGMGVSFGVLQWNFGTGTLQALLADAIAQDEAAVRGAFGDRFDTLAEQLAADRDGDRDALMVWARSIQNPGHRLNEPWRGMFKSLARTDAGQAAQVRAAEQRFDRATGMRERFGLWSERAQALMFDINVQNGSIPGRVREQIEGDTAALPEGLDAPAREVAVMRIVANRRAEAALARWVEDVRARKLCCANGEGAVHGRSYDLAAQYGLRLQRV